VRYKLSMDAKHSSKVSGAKIGWRMLLQWSGVIL
jgi:hypothetical protein